MIRYSYRCIVLILLSSVLAAVTAEEPYKVVATWAPMRHLSMDVDTTSITDMDIVEGKAKTVVMARGTYVKDTISKRNLWEYCKSNVTRAMCKFGWNALRNETLHTMNRVNIEGGTLLVSLYKNEDYYCHLWEAVTCKIPKKHFTHEKTPEPNSFTFIIRPAEYAVMDYSYTHARERPNYVQEYSIRKNFSITFTLKGDRWVDEVDPHQLAAGFEPSLKAENSVLTVTPKGNRSVVLKFSNMFGFNVNKSTDFRYHPLKNMTVKNGFYDFRGKKITVLHVDKQPIATLIVYKEGRDYVPNYGGGKVYIFDQGAIARFGFALQPYRSGSSNFVITPEAIEDLKAMYSTLGEIKNVTLGPVGPNVVLMELHAHEVNPEISRSVVVRLPQSIIHDHEPIKINGPPLYFATSGREEEL
eukprot:PhF_6_TR10819/c0_g1_i1/m.17440